MVVATPIMQMVKEGGKTTPEKEPEEPEVEEKSLQDLDLMIEEELEPAAELYESIIS